MEKEDESKLENSTKVPTSSLEFLAISGFQLTEFFLASYVAAKFLVETAYNLIGCFQEGF